VKIFVAGTTGAVGRPLVSALIAAGHSVVGLTRTPAKADIISKMGAEPVAADGLDASAIRTAIGSAAPVVIHEMTDLAGAGDLRHFDRTFASSNRLRTEGIDLLLTTAREAGVRRFIARATAVGPMPRLAAP
jgi:nucleoside-diphosphate-sugar epimerase